LKPGDSYSRYEKLVFTREFFKNDVQNPSEQGVVVHAFNPSTQEAEAGGLQVQGQPGLHSETLPHKNKI
jgi:hypothetical protein